MKYIYTTFLLIVLSSACNFEEKILEKPEIKKQISQFDKQNIISQFNYNIGLIELHKIRYGTYPETLDSLKHLNYWDSPNRFDYKKVTNGYVLNVISDTIANMTATNLNISEINLPDDFWNGLGLVKSNLRSKN